MNYVVNFIFYFILFKVKLKDHPLGNALPDGKALKLSLICWL